MNNQDRQATIEKARELIRSVWTDDLDQETQKEIARIYDDLQYIFDEEQSHLLALYEGLGIASR